MNKNQSIAVVTGSSTGIGLSTSILLARNGFYTYATMRDTKKRHAIEKIANQENLPLEILSLNVDDDRSVKKSIQKIFDKSNHIDILVNNAGYGLFGALEDVSMEAIKKQFETNLFGPIRMIKEVLPIMRKQMDGIIINVSSISGMLGIPGSSAYVSTKFALEGLSESISYEIEPYGIKLILIEPGVINTNFVSNLNLPNPVDRRAQKTILKGRTSSDNYSNKNRNNITLSNYSNTIDAFLSHYYPAMQKAPLPEDVSAVILESINNATHSSESFFRFTVGKDAKAFLEAKKRMSDSQLHEFVSSKLLK
ncbi:MAG TPA: SDR family oxidoreductase [Nitrososphaeraceae archaeon]|jgi:NAD(P)-dependent dehydrogenase (short-subunit alcohol dehydrogenase family)